jgi:DNA polymerase
LSIPQKVTKKALKAGTIDGKATWKDGEKEYYWEDDTEEYKRFRKYNRQDVVAENMADRKLPDWPEAEQRVWQLDRLINERGMPFDRKLCEGAIKVYADALDHVNSEIERITDGAVKKGTQVKALSEWINKRVNFGSSLSAPIVDEWLDLHENDESVAEVVQVLRLRRQAGSTSVSKYQKALEVADDDDRMRECLLYYGAATGRWAGRGIQPHNFIRDKSGSEAMHEAITTGSYELCLCMAKEGEGALGPKAKGIWPVG